MFCVSDQEKMKEMQVTITGQEHAIQTLTQQHKEITHVLQQVIGSQSVRIHEQDGVINNLSQANKQLGIEVVQLREKCQLNRELKELKEKICELQEANKWMQEDNGNLLINVRKLQRENGELRERVVKIK